MKTKKESSAASVRHNYAAQFKELSLERKVAQDFGLHNPCNITGVLKVAKQVSLLKIEKYKAEMARLKR